MVINNLLPKTAGTVTEENEVGAEEEDIEENDQNKNHDALWMHLQRLTRQVEVAENAGPIDTEKRWGKYDFYPHLET